MTEKLLLEKVLVTNRGEIELRIRKHTLENWNKIILVAGPYAQHLQNADIITNSSYL